MIYPVFLFGMYALKLLLKMHWITALALTVFGLFMLPKHRRLFREMNRQRMRFTEAVEYLDTLLFAFAKEEKIDQALAHVEAALVGPVRAVVREAAAHLHMTYDDADVMRESLRIVEKSYSCARIVTVHDFIVHVENYGGRIDRAVSILLSDKRRWESRILLAIRDRSKMFTDIVMSIAASLIICGIILYLPVMDMDVSTNMICQLLTAVLILLDDWILLRAQKMLAPDWLKMEVQTDPNERKRMEDYRGYNPRKELRLSMLLAVPCFAAAAAALCLGRQLPALLAFGLALLMLNQHRIGHRLARRNLTRSVKRAFPGWLMDIVLLLQSENVQMSIRKSLGQAPAVLEAELCRLSERLEMEPESVEPYHMFLKEFEIPEVHAAMSMLFSISMGHSSQVDRQIGDLIDRNLEMLDAAEKEHLANLGSGMYLLFLAPVLTASFKLVVDMAVFMLSFIAGAGI